MFGNWPSLSIDVKNSPSFLKNRGDFLKECAKKHYPLQKYSLVRALKVALQILDKNFTKILKNHPYAPKPF